MHRVILARKAEKDLNKVAKSYKPQVIAALFDLKESPYLGKLLKGKFSGYYSLRVWPYRIIYMVDKKRSKIFVIRIN